ncbi:MAG: GNAT family N-acetyltransferase [Phycisphaerales bacterium]|nr:GNAT family N-acetyltransferase [Phycisphaerales bacterium]
MTVRGLEPADLDAWIGMRQALFEDEDPDDIASEARRLASTMTLRGQPFHVGLAVRDGQAVGFIEIARRDVAEHCESSPVAYVEAWYVEPVHRTSGVGRALMDHAFAWARTTGCAEIASDAEVDNVDSARAHLALGFEDCGILRHFRRAIS